MKKPIVLTFDADGSVEFTRTKDINLFGGAGRMKRVTEIKKLDDAPQYFIKWMLGPFKGEVHQYTHALPYLTVEQLSPLITLACTVTPDAILYFDTYEAAVDHEIDMLNAMRKAGVRFDQAA